MCIRDREISGWRGMVEVSLGMREAALPGLRRLALGGTAVGTGLNCPKGFDTAVALAVSDLTGKPFTTAPNKFHALTSKDELVFAHGALKALAANLMKIANDVRWLASGPRCGLGEIRIPENEPGSSIMPNSDKQLDLLGKRFIVFELDNIKDNKVLFPIVTSQRNEHNERQCRRDERFG